MNSLTVHPGDAQISLEEQQVYVLDQDIETRVNGLPHYLREALPAFRENVGDGAYPCYFGRRALEQRELFVTHINKAGMPQFAETLAGFLDYVGPTPQRRQVLAAFAEPAGEQTHDAYGRRFWSILDWLQDHDQQPWPSDVPRDPRDPAWEFCFNGTPMFVFAAAPTYRSRRSRRLGNCLVLLFQPRNVFTGIEGGTPAGRVARRRIRDTLAGWDSAPAHPAMGDYGDPSNFEWRQYYIADDQSDMYAVCPLSAHARPGNRRDRRQHQAQQG